jgi:hypothetical protein
MPGTAEANSIIVGGGGPGIIAEAIASGTATIGYVPISTGVGAKPSWGAPATSITVEVNLGSVPKTSGKFTITNGSISPASKILCWQAPGPYTGKGLRADEAALQPISIISVEPGTGTAVVQWETPPIVINYLLLTTGETNQDRQMHSQRINRVRNNVKFTYTLFA